MKATETGSECFYSKSRKYLGTLENTNPTLLARFPNLATLERVNLIVGFTSDDRRKVSEARIWQSRYG